MDCARLVVIVAAGIIKIRIVGDTVVIAKGAKAMGAIYSKGKKKQLIVVGRGTKVTFELASVEASGGGQVKLRATPTAKDDESRPFEMKSKLMIATKGMSFIGYVAGNQEIAIGAAKK